MNTKSTNLSLVDILSDSIRSIAGTVGILGGLSYITGYVIVNFYLSQYGVTNLNLVQSRYFASGALYIILSVIICGVPLVSIYTVEKLQKDRKVSHNRIVSWALIASSFLLAGIICWASGIILASADVSGPFAVAITKRQTIIWLGLPSSQIALIFPFVVYLLVQRIVKARSSLKSEYQSIWFYSVFAALITICLLISIFIFARYVYPNSSSSIGGGAPFRVQLILSESLSRTPGFPLQINNGLTEKVILIDHSSSQLIVLQPQTNQLIEISEGEVLSIIH